MQRIAMAAVFLLAVTAAGMVGGLTATEMTPEEPTPMPHNISLQQPADVNTSAYRHAYTTVMDSVVSIKVVTARGQSQGTGFVYDTDGHIVTNHHVIRGAERVAVRFRDGEWRRAEIVGTDVYSDLAVLDVDNRPSYAAPLPVARTDPAPGTVVMALGNPFGLQETITHGIVSGVNRTMNTAGGFSIPDTVQTDAPINPGNSGGPLINTAGRVVGVNRAKQGDNIGFAISPRIVRRVVPALIQEGTYRHAYLGVRMADVSPVIAEANNMEEPRGVIVSSVVPRGPAAGTVQGSRLQAYTETGAVPIGGDIILQIAGRNVSAPRDISAYLATHTSPGDTITLTILRDGTRRQVDITLGARPQPHQYVQGG